MLRFSQSLCLFAPFVFFLLGCGEEQYATAPVSGKVVYDVRPITQGTITLVPVKDDGSPREGKAATATIAKDGTFVLTTYEKHDGAILGKHEVIYSPPEGKESDEESVTVTEDGEEEAATPVKSEAQGIEFELGVAENGRIVDVKDGENSLMIMLEKVESEEEEGE